MKMHLGIIGERAFCVGAAVLLKSIAQHTQSSQFVMHVLDMNYRAGDRQKLRKTASMVNLDVEFKFYKMTSSKLLVTILESLGGGRNKREKCWYAKFGLMDLVKGCANHLIYLDTDVYCGLNLAELRNCTENHALAAVEDQSVTSRGGWEGFGQAGMTSAPYFNAGLMCFDLRVWDEMVKVDLLKDMLCLGLDGFDQSIFNLLYHQRWHSLAPEWNVQSPFHYGKFAELAGGGGGFNLHYLTNPKPWQMPVCDESRYFYEVLDETAYAGYRPNPLFWTAHYFLRRAKGAIERKLAVSR